MTLDEPTNFLVCLRICHYLLSRSSPTHAIIFFLPYERLMKQMYRKEEEEVDKKKTKRLRLDSSALLLYKNFAYTFVYFFIEEWK